jgi:SAM-dependent methyltransferase
MRNVNRNGERAVRARNSDETLLTDAQTGGLGELCFGHPPGTFALTPASLISLQTIGQHRHLLSGLGLDWGSGTGCLAIAAARIAAVERVLGLEISSANVAIARENARRNGVEDRVAFVLADSYAPLSTQGRDTLEACAGKVSFLLANPPSSEGDDGFGFRRIVLEGAQRFLAPNGLVFLSVSYQYGPSRVEGLCREIPGFTYGGVLCSTDWVPFDLDRPDLLHCLHLYAAEERRGGLAYTFKHPESNRSEPITAQEALAHFERTGQSPLSKWQTHLFRRQRE